MNKNLPIFQGMSKPSSDFPSVRSELRAWPNYTEIDLSTARSLIAGTAARLPLCGNMIYIDPKANGGYATLHVQDDASVGNTPITALPGQLLRVPFTEIIFENDAQPGQVMRIIYGTDLEFYPSNAAGVSVLNAINVNDVVSPACQFSFLNVLPAFGAFGASQLLAPASNVSGVVVRSLAIGGLAGVGGGFQAVIVAAAAQPTALANQAAQVMLAYLANSTTTFLQRDWYDLNRRIPAGWGIWLGYLPTTSTPNLTSAMSFELL